MSLIIDVFAQLFTFIWNILKMPLALVAIFIGYLIIAVLIHIAKAMKKGFRFKKGSRQKVPTRAWYQKLFIDFPKRYAQDIMDRDADFFKYQGMYIFTGRQGNGKTVAMTEFIRRMHNEYPLSKCITNYGFKEQDKELKHWKQLLNYTNGKLGVIVGIDETQNWFSSNESKDFPPEMLGVCTQNRKNRRVICGTAQNFYLLAKAIRTQTVEVRECLTLCGCVTFVRCREPILNDVGEVVEWKKRGTYWFVHDKELRELYDTYRVIENLAKSGFQEKKVSEPVVINHNFGVK